MRRFVLFNVGSVLTLKIQLLVTQIGNLRTDFFQYAFFFITTIYPNFLTMENENFNPCFRIYLLSLQYDTIVTIQ